jgi:HPt (histidine-containing phosphotransfer) domain-containing protein
MRERGLKLPILALTANAMKGFEQELMDSGFTGYLTKPIDLDRLVETLATCLGGVRTAQAAAIATVPETAVPGPIEEPLISRLADKPRLLPTIRKFTARLAEQLDAMDRALGARDFKELAGLAHWLKGAGGTVGYDAFTEPATELELHSRAGAESEVAKTLLRLRALERRIAVPGP